ncbi:MAG: glycosyltransferase family 2 protein [Bacteroidetes bacterium]|nr:glycosyltransferase family 2 protein [Bacteroidota bacterium]
MDPFVTVIIPSFNEEKYITSLLENILHQDYPVDRIEVFIIDGLSNDRTQEIIEEYHNRHPYIQLLLNEKRYVPYALNMGIRSAKGEVIIRMDVHSEYPVNYISALLEHLVLLNADNVGGVWINKPGNETMTAFAISRVLSSGFGVGNASYRTGAREVCKVDTVPYGCYRREIFDKIGFFDEELLRNQDDEFNARLVKYGGSIYLIPSLEIIYYTRPTVKAVMKMNYQYGVYKPLVAYKIGRPAAIRQLIPFLFVLFLITGGIGSFFSTWILLALAAGSLLYLLADLLFTIKITIEAKRSSLIFFLPWIFPALHLSYGWGYLEGILRLLFRRKKTGEISSSR